MHKAKVCAVVVAAIFSGQSLAGGSILAWGQDFLGNTQIPDPNEDFVAMGTGGSHSLGLKSDGTAVGWGMTNFGLSVIPGPNEGFAAVSAAYLSSYALRSYNTGIAAGSPYMGDIQIHSVSPNPMSSSAVMRFSVPVPTTLRLDVFDIAGRKVDCVDIGSVPAGENSFLWNCTGTSDADISPGIFFLRLSGSGIDSASYRVVLIR